jgi:hypothetical protein
VRTLVHITTDTTKPGNRRYDVIDDAVRKTEVISKSTQRTPWLCGNRCKGVNYGTSTYALINPDCDVHGHVLSKD